MSAFKDLVKKGWHPEKEGTTLKSQVSSLVGRKQDSPPDRAHRSPRPLSSLQDASSFAPPPPSHSGPRNVVPAPSKCADPHLGPPPPRLPPRLPPRTPSSASASASASPRPGPARGSVPQPAVRHVLSPAVGELQNRLVAPSAPVPPPPPPPPPPPTTTTTTPASTPASTPAIASTATVPPPSQGTSWAQKQAALKTASSFRKDPSSVSLANVNSAATTANNFRQRHGHQVAAGVKTAQAINHKYAMSTKAGALAAKQHGQATAAGASPSSPAAGMVLAANMKPSPPPPPKKSPLDVSSMSPQAYDQPPAIPMSTRPTF